MGEGEGGGGGWWGDGEVWGGGGVEAFWGGGVEAFWGVGGGGGGFAWEAWEVGGEVTAGGLGEVEERRRGVWWSGSRCGGECAVEGGAEVGGLAEELDGFHDFVGGGWWLGECGYCGVGRLWDFHGGSVVGGG